MMKLSDENHALIARVCGDRRMLLPDDLGRLLDAARAEGRRQILGEPLPVDDTWRKERDAAWPFDKNSERSSK